MKSHAGVASTMFRALADRGINIKAISTSDIKVSVLIDEDETELAVRVLHIAYGPDADEAPFRFCCRTSGIGRSAAIRVLPGTGRGSMRSMVVRKSVVSGSIVPVRVSIGG